MNRQRLSARKSHISGQCMENTRHLRPRQTKAPEHRLLVKRRKRNDPPALLGRNPFSALFSRLSRDVVLNHDCHCRYHSQPHSHRTCSASLAFLSTRLHTAQHRIHISTSYIRDSRACSSSREASRVPILDDARRRRDKARSWLQDLRMKCRNTSFP